MVDAVQTLGRLEAHRADVAEGVETAYLDNGHAIVNEDGETIVSKTALAEAIRARVLQTQSNSKKDRESNAVVLAELAAAMFPETPHPSSEDWDSDDEVMVGVWDTLSGTVTRMVQTGRRGRVQKMLAADPDTSTLLLCNTTVGAAQNRAVYVTDNAALILADYAVPRTAKVNNAAAALAEEFAFAIERNPSMKKSLTAKAEDGIKAANSSVRARLALTSGDEPESGA